MMPPLVRRCPACGHVNLSRRFVVVDADPRRVECPACHDQFATIGDPRLA